MAVPGQVSALGELEMARHALDSPSTTLNKELYTMNLVSKIEKVEPVPPWLAGGVSDRTLLECGDTRVHLLWAVAREAERSGTSCFRILRSFVEGPASERKVEWDMLEEFVRLQLLSRCFCSDELS